MSASPLRLLSTAPAIVARSFESTHVEHLMTAGTLLEISCPYGLGRTSTAVRLVRVAQEEGETCAWVMHENVTLHAPDLIDAGLDLGALVFVRIPLLTSAHALVKAAELLLRSGGFGLVIVDLVGGAPRGAPSAWQGRLLGLAREHRARIVLLSSSDETADSLGPLVGVRLAPRRTRIGDRFCLELDALKTKAHRIERITPRTCRAPAGL